jgi:hypothetical protein
MEAVRFGATSNVKLLLAFGADPLRRSANNMRAIDQQSNKNQDRIQRLLHSHVSGNSIDEPLSAVTREVLRAIRTLSAFGEANAEVIFSDFCISDGALFLHSVDEQHEHRPVDFPEEWTFPRFAQLWDPATCEDYELIVTRLNQAVERLYESLLPNCRFDFKTHDHNEETRVLARVTCESPTVERPLTF